jgi:hypothetical protein
MLQLCDGGIRFVDRICQQSVKTEGVGRARKGREPEGMMNTPGRLTMLKHSISVRGRVELLEEKVRCEQRVRVTNGPVFSQEA